MRLSKPDVNPAYHIIQECGNEVCQNIHEEVASTRKEAPLSKMREKSHDCGRSPEESEPR